jgi:hypothetical protein
MDQEMSKTVNWILRLAVTVLAGIIAVVSLALVGGLFVSNEIIDNAKIFELIGPAFNTVIGAFVGLLGGLSINNNGSVSLKQEPPPPAPVSPPAPVVVAPTPVAPVPVVPTLNTVVAAAPVVATAAVAVPTVVSSEVVTGFGGKPAPVQPDHPEI